VANGAAPLPVWLGPVIGLLTAGLALAVAQLIAQFVGEMTSPMVAVGQAAIDLSPPWLKDFAIRTFGSHDKLVLLIGVGVVLAVFAILLGVLFVRHRSVGPAGLVLFGAVGVLAAMTRPTHDTLSPLPSVVGVLAGWLALRAFGARLPAPPTRAKPVESPVGFDRRRFLLAGLATGAAAVVAGVGSEVVGRATSRAVASRAAVRIPQASNVPPRPVGAQVDVPGVSPFYTSNDAFYRVDTAIIVPKVTSADWRLRIHGMVDREIELDYAGLLRRPLVERDVTLTCVSNPVGGPYIGNARWTGALLAPILAEAGIHAGATQLVSRSVDGFTVGSPTAALTDGRDAMLAVAMNGQPLPLAHGFPVRMVVPGLYGFVSATKWVVDMELTTFEAYDAYWVQRGWSQQAPIKTQSRIDTPRTPQQVRAGTVAVAGVAWAQHRGIARVEVRVDDGPWQEAQLATQDTIDTWREWVYGWPATVGWHTLQVRATDGTGAVQTEAQAPPAPNGATGYHHVRVQVV
jgi:DMSO/TMAO reductase YedYZ molybdopterin-dependent catalytic subunit